MPSPAHKDEPAWLTLARAEIGVREGAGAANSPVVLQYYRDARHPEIEHDDVAWCAAFACAMLERAGVRSPRALIATGMGSQIIHVQTDTGPLDLTAIEWQSVLLASAQFRQPIWLASFAILAKAPIPADYASNIHW